MKKSIKVSVIIFILIGLIVVGFFAWENLKKSENQDEDAGWQTYTNEKYGFELKYPDHFFVEEFTTQKPTVLAVGFTDNQWENQNIHNPALYLYIIETDLSAQQWLDENGTAFTLFDDPGPEKSYQLYDVKDIEENTINDISVLQFSSSAVSSGSFNTIFKKEPDLLFRIEAHSSGIGTFPQDIYDQILSAFRFIEESVLEGVEFCDEITSTYEKWQCYVDLAKEKSSEAYCENIEDNLYKSDCYEALAVIKKDETLCDKIPVHLLDISRPSCYADVALEKNDETVCGKLSDAEEQNSCYKKFAYQKKDESFCENIAETEGRDACYYYLAYTLEDELICGKIYYSEERDACYSKVSLILDDPTICDKAADPSVECKKYFEALVMDSSNWTVYRGEAGNFEFRIAPIFEEVGYEITETKSSLGCDVVSFKTHAIAPYYSTTEPTEMQTFIHLYVCPEEYCRLNEEKEQFCEALREDLDETEGGIWMFATYVLENENFIAYEQKGPSTGDLYDAFGWLKGEVLGAKDNMLSTFKFLE